MRMNNRKLWTIFAIVCIVSVISFLTIGLGTKNTEDGTVATQGIKLLKQIESENDYNEKMRIKLGDMLIGDGDTVYFIQEIRKGANGKVFVVVGWKKLLDFSSYDEFYVQPLKRSTFELKKFLINKQHVTQQELMEIYKNISQSRQVISDEAARIKADTNSNSSTSDEEN